MAITLNDLTVGFRHLDRESLLDEWRWLIGDKKQPVLLTCLGNAFVQDIDDASVQLLDVAAGELLPIAQTAREFEALLRDEDFVTEWFAPGVVVQLRENGRALPPGKIFSFVVPPFAGGEFSLYNLEPLDIPVHFALLGQLCREARDAPPGTQIVAIMPAQRSV
ncbi:MAG: T6SS immunity protein Tdi1 domain-containing protein [Capsulimonadaceae bacterium]